MSTLGHRLAFLWGFSFAVVCGLMGLEENGFHIRPGVLPIAMVATVALMFGAWFRCAYEKRLLS